jgi:hypothetical protein
MDTVRIGFILEELYGQHVILEMPLYMDRPSLLLVRSCIQPYVEKESNHK